MRKEKLVTTHMSRLKARPRLLEVDPECLRWTPVIVTNTVVSDGEEDEEDDDDYEENGENDRKEVRMCGVWRRTSFLMYVPLPPETVSVTAGHMTENKLVFQPNEDRPNVM